MAPMSAVLVVCLLSVVNGFTVPVPVSSTARSLTAVFGGLGFDKKSTLSNQRKKKKGKRSVPKKDASRVPPKPDKSIDKWGLPILSQEEIIRELFPPLSKETEIIPVDPEKDYTLKQIQDCLKNHIDLKLGRLFNETGAATPPTGEKPIQIKLLHKSPPVLELENFFSEEECRELKKAALTGHEVSSATFSGSLSTRTSTSWFCNYSDVPLLLAKVNQYLNTPLWSMEEPQLVRYQANEQFTWHYDQIPSDGLHNGGQRIMTILAYLNDVSADHGGGTMFRDLEYDSKPLVMQPKLGSVLLFFPASNDGPDERTLHRSQVLLEKSTSEIVEKWILQMWCHERKYQPALPVGNSQKASMEVVRKTIAKLRLVQNQ